MPKIPEVKLLNNAKKIGKMLKKGNFSDIDTIVAKIREDIRKFLDELSSPEKDKWYGFLKGIEAINKSLKQKDKFEIVNIAVRDPKLGKELLKEFEREINRVSSWIAENVTQPTISYGVNLAYYYVLSGLLEE